MTNNLKSIDEKTLNDIGNAVTQPKINKNVLVLKNKVLEEDGQLNKQRHNLFKDMNETLEKLEQDNENPVHNKVKQMVKNLKKSKSDNLSKECGENTSLENLVLSLLEPKIQNWINENLESILESKIQNWMNQNIENLFRTLIEKEIGKIMNED